MSEQTPAFKALVNLAKLSRSAAQDLPSQEEAEVEWNGLGFSLLGKQFVVPMGQVSEIIEVPSYTRLPGVKPWVKGVANVRGRLLPVLDLAAFLGARLINPLRRQRVLILENQELYCGLVVDQSFGIQRFLSEAYRFDMPIEEESVKAYLLGGYTSGKDNWHVFSMVNLVEDAEFSSASKV